LQTGETLPKVVYANGVATQLEYKIDNSEYTSITSYELLDSMLLSEGFSSTNNFNKVLEDDLNLINSNVDN